MNSLIGDVPDSWRRAILGELCDILPGPSGDRMPLRSPEPGDVPVVAPRDFRDHRIIRGRAAVPPEVAERLGRYRLASGDVVCARTGELGRQALVGADQEGWLVGTACLLLRVSGPVSGSFLVYYLGHPSVRTWILNNSGGSAIRSLTKDTIRTLPVVCPPIRQQDEIVGVLAALDRKIAIHDEIGRVTAKLRDSLLPLLLTGENSFTR